MTSVDQLLFPLVADPSADPSEYMSASFDDGAQAIEKKKTQFWLESHALSCFKNSSFLSSVQITVGDTLPPSFIESTECGHDEYNAVMKIIGDSCAYITNDGVINNNDNTNQRHYTTAICRKGEGAKNNNDSTCHKSKIFMTNEQIETIGRLASHIVGNDNTKQRRDTPDLDSNNNEDSEKGHSWFQSPIKVAKKVTSVINYAIDSALNIYEGEGYYAAANAEYADVDDVKGNFKALGKTFDEKEDDEQSRRRRRGIGSGFTCEVEEDLSVSDEVISISSIAMACNHLLSYSQMMQFDDSNVSDMFILHNNIGEIERIMLERHGWSSGSLGSLCRQAGKFFTSSSAEDDIDVRAKDTFIRFGIGKILSNVTIEGVDILATTLCQSNYSIIDNDVITLYPRGIPSGLDEASRKSDHALYQIHVTKVATHNRIRRLEKDAETAKSNALSYQKRKMTKVALVHMRRRKAVLEEIDRCATILENLTAGELRLERAKGDVQIVQSYTQLKQALQDVRKSSGMENEDVEDLMNDLREEMELSNYTALSEEVYNTDAIDEDELYEEFRLLEIECEDESPSPRKDVCIDEQQVSKSSNVAADIQTQSPVSEKKPQTPPSKQNFSDEVAPLPS